MTTVELKEEDGPEINLLLVSLAALADDMMQAGDPFGERLDTILMRFTKKVLIKDGRLHE